MTTTELKEKIMDMLVEVCQDDIIREEPDIDLDEENLIDSMGYTELLIMIEDELGIYISPSEYTRQEFNTPAKIVSAVRKKMENQ